jgi:LuxR family maltose regulon positive regulatory protein
VQVSGANAAPGLPGGGQVTQVSAQRREASVPAGRREHFRVMLAILRLHLARQRGDLRAVAEEVERLQSIEALDVAQPGLGAELRALALITLGIAELWSMRVHEAEAHLEPSVVLARRTGRPFLEINGLAHWEVAASFRSSALAAKRSRQAIELARRHGWNEEPVVAIAYPMLAGSLIWQGELDEAERWLAEGERALQSAVEPTTEMLFQLARGFLDMARGHLEAALATLRATERLPGRLLAAAHPLTAELHAFLLHVLVRLRQTTQADAAFTGTAPEERERPGICTVAAALLLAQDNPRGAAAALEPVLDISAPVSPQAWLIAAFLLEASAREAASTPSGTARRPCRAPARAAQPGRDPRPAFPADQPVRAGDRPRALCVGEHGPDAHAAPVRQARRSPPPGSHRPGSCPRPARARSAKGLTLISAVASK